MAHPVLQWRRARVKRIQIDTASAAAFREALKRASRTGMLRVLAADPGTGSTGWSITASRLDSLERPVTVRAGQGRLESVGDLLRDLPPHEAFDLAVIESPYTQGATKGRANLSALWKLGRAIGYVEAVIACSLSKPPLWRPTPTHWRSIVSLNAQKTKTETARENTAAAVWHFARAKSGLPLEGPGGGRQIDAAMAVAMAIAALRLLAVFRRMPR